jgi:hypothetical protein
MPLSKQDSDSILELTQLGTIGLSTIVDPAKNVGIPQSYRCTGETNGPDFFGHAAWQNG